jgi:hypothetical protein
VHESLPGTSRHFTAMQHSGRFRGEADMDRQAKPAGSVENDPSATSGAQICCDAQRGFSWNGVVG